MSLLIISSVAWIPLLSPLFACVHRPTLSEDQTRTLMELCESMIPIIKKKM